MKMRLASTNYMDVGRAAQYLEICGFTVSREKTETGRPTATATKETAKGVVRVYVITEGAQVRKPNGTFKYYYDVTNNQFVARINQLLAYNN